MRLKFSQLFFSVFLILIYFSCANVKPPTGGPRDTIPPVLVKSVPSNKSLNFKGNTIKLTYDENLKIDNLKKNLIITPMGNLEYDSKFRKNYVEIIFKSPLKDSTTYTLNFQSAIKDITEGNITRDNTFAFSTGNFIDSLHISGLTTELLTTDTLKNVTVGLYSVQDTFNLFKGRPLYFTKSDDMGKFLIDNIKAGDYFIQAFADVNDNLACDMPKEQYAFLPDTINLNQNLDSLHIRLLALDIRPLKIQKALPSGKYFEIGFNKYIMDFNVEPQDTTSHLYYNVINDGKGIRFYNTLKKDSIKIILNATDSILSHVTDTLYVKFTESKRKSEEFTYKLFPSNNSKIPYDYKGIISFSKPVKFINTDSVFIRYDSIHIDTLHIGKELTYNRYRDTVSIQTTLNKNLLTAGVQASSDKSQNNNSIPPTNSLASTSKAGKKQSGPTLYLGEGAFISVENDSSKRTTTNYQILKEENYGIIRGNVDTNFKSFFIQLVDSKYKIISELYSVKQYSFINIPEGDYRIRVLIDNNGDGRWNPGNFYKNIPPEGVYFYPGTITVRANWELRDINLAF